MAKKKTTNKPKRAQKSASAVEELALRTYRIVYGTTANRDPELVQAHAVNVYGSCCEFVRFEETKRDPDGEWVTMLVLPAASFERVEVVNPDHTHVTTLAPGTNRPFYGDGIVDVTEAPESPQ